MRWIFFLLFSGFVGFFYFGTCNFLCVYMCAHVSLYSPFVRSIACCLLFGIVNVELNEIKYMMSTHSPHIFYFGSDSIRLKKNSNSCKRKLTSKKGGEMSVCTWMCADSVCRQIHERERETERTKKKSNTRVKIKKSRMFNTNIQKQKKNMRKKDLVYTRTQRVQKSIAQKYCKWITKKDRASERERQRGKNESNQIEKNHIEEQEQQCKKNNLHQHKTRKNGIV